MHNANQTRVSFLNAGFVFRKYSKGALQLTRSMAAQTDNPEFWRCRAEEVRTTADSRSGRYTCNHRGLAGCDLGQRLAGTAADREALRNGLRTRRQSVLSDAFEPRHPPEAA